MFHIYEPLITSLFICGLYYATSYELNREGQPTEKNVLWFFRFYVEKYIGEPFGKPIILCPQCMASFWGAIVYFGYLKHSILPFHWFILFVFVTSALNLIVQKIIE